MDFPPGYPYFLSSGFETLKLSKMQKPGAMGGVPVRRGPGAGRDLPEFRFYLAAKVNNGVGTEVREQ